MNLAVFTSLWAPSFDGLVVMVEMKRLILIQDPESYLEAILIHSPFP
jgi:hypothetical protein